MCNHRGISQMLGKATLRGRLAIVSVWEENGDVLRYMARNPDVDRIRLCAEVAEGLKYLHSNKIVHGSLMGRHILISRDGRALLTGFGSAHLLDDDMLPIELDDKLLDPPGGSYQPEFRWAAPELLTHELAIATPETDIYSLGMTILEIHTGEIPYSERESNVKVMMAKLLLEVVIGCGLFYASVGQTSHLGVL
ncbi:hypothetical protein FRC09_010563 [Ceratobasidium sp. 395]|nr:hypothetical protein FRC09_010563 [Ceratobasidium sp. 395]